MAGSKSWPAIHGLLGGEIPAPRSVGVRMTLHHRGASPGRYRCEVVFEKGAENNQGIVHGGFLASILDIAMGYASLTILGENDLQRTLELQVNYLRAVPPDRVIAEGEVLRPGRRTAYCEGSIRSADGELVARGSATFAIRRDR